RARSERLERQPACTSLGTALQIFFQQKGVVRQQWSLAGLHQGWDFVTKAQHAARLEPDDGNPATSKRRQRRDAALCLTARFIHESNRKKSAPAAERARAPVHRCRQMHTATRRRKHIQRRGKVLRLEITVERVGK